MNIEEQRKAFDRWVLSHPDNLDLTAYEENIMFDAWLASANRDGYKLVPIELIERCISHIGIASCHPANNLQDDQQMELDIDALEKAMIGACDDH